MIVVSHHCVKPASKALLATYMLRRDVAEVKVVEVAKKLIKITRVSRSTLDTRPSLRSKETVNKSWIHYV